MVKIPLVSDLILALRFLGLINTLRIIANTVYRDWINLKFPPKAAEEIRESHPGKLLEASIAPQSAIFRFENASLEISFLLSDLVKISWSPGIPPAPYALVQRDWPGCTIDIQQIDNHYYLSSSSLKLIVESDGSLTFQDISGQTLRSELPPRRIGDSWQSVAIIHENEHVYGLGEQSGSFDLSGGCYRLWNNSPGGDYAPGTNPLYINIPVYLSMHSNGAYYIFYENSFESIHQIDPQNGDMDIHSPRTIRSDFKEGMLRYYFIPGSPLKALERFSQLTGRAPLPPKWSLGYHQSRWGYRNKEEIHEVLEAFIQHNLPLSAIHLDIDYMDDHKVFTIDQDRFSDIESLVEELETHNVKLVAIIDPGIKKDLEYPVFKDGLDHDMFCRLPDGRTTVGLAWPGWIVYPDFTNPEVRQWWGEKYRFLQDVGIAGFWHDMNEPTSITAWGDLTIPRSTQHSMDGRHGDHREAHNLYGLLMNRSGYEAILSHDPDRRPWILSRSGWAGMQRHAWSWTGDMQADWDSLRTVIPMMLGLSLSGIPYSGSDIGGFTGNPSLELHLRWFQMAAFMPFFRTHSARGTKNREPWVHGEPYTSIFRNYLNFRYRLHPYLYTLAWKCSTLGHPIIRPLFWLSPENQDMWDIDDEFILGDDLLVAPILQPKANSREVVLPEGNWTNLWTKECHKGPATILEGISLDHIPVYARSGSVLPLQDSPQLLSLHIFPGDGESVLYNDAGDGFGPWRVDQFVMETSQRHMEIVRQVDGDYPFPFERTGLVFHGNKVKSIRVDGLDASVPNNRIELEGFSKLRIEYAG